MPSIHKDPRGKSPFWYCAFNLPDGRRAFRSTKEIDRAAAQASCQRWANESEVLGEAPKLENKNLVLETFIAVSRQAAKGEFTETTARKMLDEILRAAGQRTIEKSTIRGFLEAWLESKSASTAAGTVRRYRDIVEPFLKSLGSRAELDLSALTAKDVQDFRDKELRAGKSNKTANMAVKTLRIALNLARRQGLLLTNPAEAVDQLTEHSAERGTFTVKEILQLLATADQEWRGMILLGACAGLRIADAARLTWAQIDLERKALRFKPQKTQSKMRGQLEIPILLDLEAYLLELPVKSRKPDAPLFPTLSRKKPNGHSGLSNTFTRLIHQAGINNPPVSQPVAGKGRVVYSYGFHALRHTFVSMMANTGVSKELRMKLAGHTSHVHDRYTHHELQTFRDALADFPRFSHSTTPERRTRSKRKSPPLH